MTFPQVGGMSEEEKAKARAEFLQLAEENPSTDQPSPKRGRGRPPGSKNKARPSDYAPFRTPPTETVIDEATGQPIPTLAPPKLSTRDQREVAERLAGILQAGSSIASLAKPYFEMTDEEASNIAIPLSTYLIRTEATSKTAMQILDEYDLAAFILALAAYVVRVYMDFQKERKGIKATNVTPAVNVERASEDNKVTEPVAANSLRPDGRTVERTVAETIQQSPTQTQIGEERPVSRELASSGESGWVPASL